MERFVLKRRVIIAAGIGSFAAIIGRHAIKHTGKQYLPNFAQPPLQDAAACANESLGESRFAEENALENAFSRFAAVGDVGTGQSAQYKVSRAMLSRWCAEPFGNVLLLGDNIYENGEIEKVTSAFERPYADLLEKGVKFNAALGNHDFRTHEGSDQVAYSGYNMPGRYYSFSQQEDTPRSVQFFALDTNQYYLDHHENRNNSSTDEETLWAQQRRWLETELKQSVASWKVVFAHHPIYSSGRHGSDEELASSLTPLFKAYGVQLYINGHDHNYERTQPIDGTTYITSGNGAKLRPTGRESWTAYASSQLGFTAFDVYADRIVIKAIDVDNNIYDESQI
ncbi:MAG: metallophosphoesterase [Phormidesmis sp.]